MFDATNTVNYDVAINLFISVIVDKFKEEIMIF